MNALYIATRCRPTTCAVRRYRYTLPTLYPPLPRTSRTNLPFNPPITPSRCFAAVDESNDRYSPDVLIIGSGSAALAAALRCKHHGLEPLIVEKTSKIGG